MLAQGKGQNGIDEMDNVNDSTPLHVACEQLKNLKFLEILLDHGADVNSVNSDSKLPLTIIKERLEKEPDNE